VVEAEVDALDDLLWMPCAYLIAVRPFIHRLPRRLPKAVSKSQPHLFDRLLACLLYEYERSISISTSHAHIFSPDKDL